MSTIEKAAARLAEARKRSGAKPSGKGAGADSSQPSLSGGVAVEIRERSEPLMQQGAAGHAAPLPRSDSAGELVHLDLDAIRARGFLAPGASRTPLAQQMRRLKRPLLLKLQRARVDPQQGPPPNLIMITSSVPGEGKTFTSINLAMSMAAELDHSVLLVDADASRGDVVRQLGLPRKRGLSGLLLDGSEAWEQEKLRTNVERLSILPCGDPVEHLDELYASSTMARIVDSLARSDPDRIVIFDCAPLLLATEVAVLAQLMGQIIVVVEANRTPRDLVARSLGMLEGLQNVSLVLNKSTVRAESDYGYGYGAFDDGNVTSSAAER